MSMNGEGAVYVQTNEADNSVIAFRRSADGTLEELGAYATGGTGSGAPHLQSQGSVALSGDGRHLLAANAGSGDVSVFAVGAGGLELLQTLPSGGTSPTSVAERGGLVYVLNAGDPSLAGFRLVAGGLEPLAGSRRELAPDADPAQVGFSPDGGKIVVTERGTNSISFHAVGEDGDVQAVDGGDGARLHPGPGVPLDQRRHQRPRGRMLRAEGLHHVGEQPRRLRAVDVARVVAGDVAHTGTSIEYSWVRRTVVWMLELSRGMSTASTSCGSVGPPV